MDNNARMRDALVKAGWHRQRSGGSHGIWHCPCGQHMASVPDGSSKRGDHSKNANPVLRRVQQCQQEMLARVAAGQPAIPEKPTPPVREDAVTPEPATPAVDPAPTRHVVFDGLRVEVLAAEPAIGPHPRYKTPVKYAGVSKLLLADGREIYACDDCPDQERPFVSLDAAGPRSHRGNTHMRTKPHAPLTAEKTIRAVIAAVSAAREHGQGDGLRVAAEALNAAKVYTSRGKPWSRGAIQAVWNRYKDEYPVEATMPKPRSTPPRQPVRVGDPLARETNLTRVAPPQPARATNRTAWMAIVADMDLNDIAYMQVILAGRVDEINRALRDADAQAKLDDVIRDKAARFDQLQKLMGTT